MTRQMASEDIASQEPVSETPRRVTGSIPMDALERLQGDDVLDLPPIEPIPGAPIPVDDVIDLDLPPIAEPAGIYAAVEPQPPDWMPESTKTVAFGSKVVEDVIEEKTVTADLPPPRPVPPPISLPPSISVTQPMSAMNLPVFGSDISKPSAHEVQDEQEVLPTAPFDQPAPSPWSSPSSSSSPSPSLSTSPFEPDPGVVDADHTAPFDAADPASRMTPAEMSVNQQRAWVAPDVQAPESRSRFGLLAIVAVLVVVVCLGLAWQFVLKDVMLGRPAASTSRGATTAPAAPPTAPDSGPSVPAASSPSTPPVDSSKAPDPNAPAASSTAPAQPAAGSGGFTIQIRSSPNESDAKQFVDSLKAAGFDAYVMRADLGAKGVWFRVRVGRFQSREEAQREIVKLRSSARTTEAIIQPFAES